MKLQFRDPLFFEERDKYAQDQRYEISWTGRCLYIYIKEEGAYVFSGYTNLLGEAIDYVYPELWTKQQWLLHGRRYKITYVFDSEDSFLNEMLDAGIRRPMYNRDDWSEYEAIR